MPFHFYLRIIHNSNGQLIQESLLNQRTKMDISQLSARIYLYRIENDQENSTGKFIKKQKLVFSRSYYVIGN
ncbi:MULTISPECIES: T9SS type A sorting domain-containing protein [unclassified Tamlana]|uniref:T9SS type A sorting domain-containing protein n=1 Tax=unclassified Tamlana TaxID=2614803 RepID=UPI0034C5C2F1